jgi:transposase
MVLEPLLPPRRVTGGRRRGDDRVFLEAVAWKYRTGSPWRDLPERFGKWNTVFKRFDQWAKDGVLAGLLEKVQQIAADNGDVDWAVSIDSTIVRVHQHGATLPRTTGGVHRTTRSSGRNPRIMRSAAPAAG